MREGHRSQGPPPPYYEDSGYHHRSSSNYHPPPPYISAPPTGLVGGPGASLPTQGPNQIFVTNVSILLMQLRIILRLPTCRKCFLPFSYLILQHGRI